MQIAAKRLRLAGLFLKFYFFGYRFCAFVTIYNLELIFSIYCHVIRRIS